MTFRCLSTFKTGPYSIRCPPVLVVSDTYASVHLTLGELVSQPANLWVKELFAELDLMIIFMGLRLLFAELRTRTEHINKINKIKQNNKTHNPLKISSERSRILNQPPYR